MQEAFYPARSKCLLCWCGGVTPSSHGGGVPHPVMVGGVPHPVMLGGTPSSHGGGTLGTPHHPDLAGGVHGVPPTIQTWLYPPPSRPGLGTPPHHQDLAGDGVPSPTIQTWLGYPHPPQTWDGVPLTPDLGWGTPHKCGQTHRLMSKHYLPSYFVHRQSLQRYHVSVI